MLKKLGVEIGETTNPSETPVAGNDVDADRSAHSSASAQVDETVKVTEKFRDGLWFADIAGHGRLVADRARSRYLEKYVVTNLQLPADDFVLNLVDSNLWTSLSDEVHSLFGTLSYFF